MLHTMLISEVIWEKTVSACIYIDHQFIYHDTMQKQIIKKECKEWTLLVASAFLNSMTLSALSLEDLLSGFWVSARCFLERRHYILFTATMITLVSLLFRCYLLPTLSTVTILYVLVSFRTGYHTPPASFLLKKWFFFIFFLLYMTKVLWFIWHKFRMHIWEKYLVAK